MSEITEICKKHVSKKQQNFKHYFLFRYITGESVGLVLGGGGARGLSHIGMVKSTLEAGIPIDHVAGVSIGALIGGLYAVERDLREVTLKARSFSTRFAQQWR